MLPCRCLLWEAGQEELSRTVEELLSQMPEEKRAPEEARQARLHQCKSCDHLMSGTCALCGCYVELRAAGREQCCPDVPPRWNEEGGC